MKAVRITLAGRERYRSFTVEAMFAIQEIFGGFGELVEAIRDTGLDRFSAVWTADRAGSGNFLDTGGDKGESQKKGDYSGYNENKKAEKRDGQKDNTAHDHSGTRQATDRNIADFCWSRGSRIAAGRNPIAAVWTGRRRIGNLFSALGTGN